jgi:hypothetical protein
MSGAITTTVQLVALENAKGKTIMTKLGSFTGLVVAVCLGWAALAHADVVSDWDAVTVLYVSVGDPSAVPSIPVGRGGPAHAGAHGAERSVAV